MDKSYDIPLQGSSNKSYHQPSAKSKASTIGSEELISKRELHKDSVQSSSEIACKIEPLRFLGNYSSFLMPTESSLGKVKKPTYNSKQNYSTKQCKSTKHTNQISYKEKMKEFDKYINERVKAFVPPIIYKRQPHKKKIHNQTKIEVSKDLSENEISNVLEDCEEHSFIEEIGEDPNKPRVTKNEKKRLQEYNSKEDYFNKLDEPEKKYEVMVAQFKEDRNLKIQPLIKRGSITKEYNEIMSEYKTDEHKETRRSLNEQQQLENREVIAEYGKKQLNV